ncbi:MAG: DUF3383 family protein [Pseudomonadota bacterium]
MALSDVVNLTITRQSRPLERAGFGTTLFLTMHRAWDDRIKYYTDASDMLDDGFAATEDAYRAAVRCFAQSPKPEQIAIGRLATADAVIVVVDTVTSSTRYTVFVDGIGFDYSADASATTTEIEAGLTAAINSGYTIIATDETNDTFTVAGNHLAAFVAGKTFRVTGSTTNDGTYTVASVARSSGNTVITVDEDVIAEGMALGTIKSATAVTATNSVAGDGEFIIEPDVAATFFECKAGSNMHLEFDLDESMDTALSAIEDEDSTGWYFVALAHQFGAGFSSPANDDLTALQKDLSDLIETRRKIFVAACADANLPGTTAAADDDTSGTFARYIQGRSYARSVAFYNAQADNGLDVSGGDPDPYADVGWIASRATSDPGRETWKFASVSGIVADELSTTERANVLAKNANCYTAITTSVSITEEGTVGDGEFIDVVRLCDALYDAVTTEVFSALTNPTSPLVKVPFTNGGIAVVETAIKKALDPYTGPTKGLSEYTVTVPDEDDVSDADKANRTLTGVEFVGYLTGAIHSATVNGFVTV